MRHDIGVAIIGTLILIAGIVFILYRNSHKGMIYVNCDSFKTQQEAQKYFTDNNATQLDADKDGRACQTKSTPRVSVSPTPVISRQPSVISTQNPTPSPVTIKVEGKATIEVKQSATTQQDQSSQPTKMVTPTIAPSPSPTQNPTANPTSTVTPTPTLICVLGLCL